MHLAFEFLHMLGLAGRNALTHTGIDVSAVNLFVQRLRQRLVSSSMVTMAVYPDGCSPGHFCTFLTARSRISGENLFDLLLAQSSQSVEPARYRGAIQSTIVPSDRAAVFNFAEIRGGRIARDFLQVGTAAGWRGSLRRLPRWQLNAVCELVRLFHCLPKYLPIRRGTDPAEFRGGETHFESSPALQTIRRKQHTPMLLNDAVADR